MVLLLLPAMSTSLVMPVAEWFLLMAAAAAVAAAAAAVAVVFEIKRTALGRDRSV